MGISKSEKFTAEQNKLAAFSKAFGHPARIAIVQYLLEVNACVCGDLVDVLPLSQATVSQHLKELKKAGIIDGEVEGRNVCYCINKDAWNERLTILDSFFRKIKNCC